MGLGHGGRLVTSAAAILMLSFLSMSAGPQTDLKVPAIRLGADILIDAVIVRCLLVPALVALFGGANWWLPSRLSRLRRIPTPASWECDHIEELSASPPRPGKIALLTIQPGLAWPSPDPGISSPFPSVVLCQS